jgi:hypothetical protein
MVPIYRKPIPLTGYGKRRFIEAVHEHVKFGTMEACQKLMTSNW